MAFLPVIRGRPDAGLAAQLYGFAVRPTTATTQGLLAGFGIRKSIARERAPARTSKNP